MAEWPDGNVTVFVEPHVCALLRATPNLLTTTETVGRVLEPGGVEGRVPERLCDTSREIQRRAGMTWREWGDIGEGAAARRSGGRTARAFGRSDGQRLVAHYRERFISAAGERGVPSKLAEAIFGKFNPHYMLPEGHAVTFAFTAYQMAWLPRYYPWEFFVALFDEQPLGIWDVDTLKHDARRLGLQVAHPDVNRSELLCTAEGDDALRLRLTFVKGVNHRLGGDAPAGQRCWPICRFIGPAGSIGLAARGSGESGPGRRHGRAVRLHRPAERTVAGGRRGQLALSPPAVNPPSALTATSRARRMLDEYTMLGLCPDCHVMELMRSQLGPDVLTSDGLLGCRDGDVARVAGGVARRQRPLAAAVFLTLEDEHGLIPLAVWPAQWDRLKGALRRSLVVEGQVSRRDDTLNVTVRRAWPLALDLDSRHGRRDWQ